MQFCVQCNIAADTRYAEHDETPLRVASQARLTLNVAVWFLSHTERYSRIKQIKPRTGRTHL